jgi:integrase
MSSTEASQRGKGRAPKGAVVKNPVKGGFAYALRFTAYGERRYVSLGRPEGGWTEHKAEEELRRILAEVRDGMWKPWQPQEEPEQPEEELTFHEFASEWFEATKSEWREATRLDYEWQLQVHVLPFFKDHGLSQITVAEVDRYRESKLADNRAIEAAAAKGKPRMRTYTDKRSGNRYKRPERPLSPASINKTVTRLGQILEVAVERELIERNPVRVNPRNRKVKTTRPGRTYLDRAEQIEALLDAAGKMDREAKSNGRLARRALLSALTFAGLRISEALKLRWREVDLAGGRLRVRESKTSAGVRYVDLLPVLHDELTTLKANRTPESGALVFPSAVGTAQDRNRTRNRILNPAIEHANEQLIAEGSAPLPDGLTQHGLRRTFCSLLVALGRDPAYVMRQMGHTDPTVTLGIYAHVMQAREEDRARLRALVGADDTTPAPAEALSATN